MNNIHTTIKLFLDAGLSLATVHDDALREALDAGMLGDEADSYADRVTLTAAEVATNLLERDMQRQKDREGK